MTSRLSASGNDRSAARVLVLGPGWVWPAVVVALLVTLVYLPGHHSTADAVDGLIASAAALYVVGLSVALVRLVRGAILRIGGSSESIVILGHGPDTATDVRIRARWRLGSTLAGTLVAVSGVALSAWLGRQADALTYAQALATLGLGANLALAAGVLVPAPGFAGWALLVALVDAAGTSADRRIRLAAQLAQVVGIPLFAGFAVAATLLGDPMLVLLGIMLTFFIATQSGLAVGRDAIARFLEGRVVADLARPLISHVDADEAVEEIVARLPAQTVVMAVETSGALVGAIGPLQLAARDRQLRGQRASELMVGLGQLPLLRASTQGTDVLPAIARHGFALVRDPEGLMYIEANDLLAQIQASVARPAHGAAGADASDSGS